jgi:hypothetical protein
LSAIVDALCRAVLLSLEFLILSGLSGAVVSGAFDTIIWFEAHQQTPRWVAASLHPSLSL